LAYGDAMFKSASSCVRYAVMRGAENPKTAVGKFGKKVLRVSRAAGERNGQRL
jgi:hypothetical protein